MEEYKYEYYRKRIVKNRCKACHPCPMGVTGCQSDVIPHGHGGSQTCPECGVSYYEVHPHSRCCSRATPILSHLVHDDYFKTHQLAWKCREPTGYKLKKRAE